MSQGIDYAGRFSIVNRDPDTGIRYGVISTHAMNEWFWDDVNNDYGEATCPKCGSAAVDSGDDSIPATADREDWDYKGDDYACIACKSTFWSDQCFSDELCGWSIDDGAYKVINCLDSDAMVIKSPYFTYARFCSPCVPGACSMDSPIDAADIAGAAKCYCFGHDWFDSGTAPYPVYSVDTGELVPAGEVQS